jgi:hypothetical protein
LYRILQGEKQRKIDNWGISFAEKLRKINAFWGRSERLLSDPPYLSSTSTGAKMKSE